jgi:AcrR family transcriptional regulator
MGHTPRTPKQERSAATREQLLAAARSLFAEEGFHGTNTKKIAARAGAAVGSFYAYFRNKKEIFVEVVRGYYRETAAGALGDLDPAAAAWTPPERLPEVFDSLVRRLYAAHDMEPSLHREIIGMCYTDPEMEELIAEEDERVIGKLTELLRAFQPSLAVEDTEAAARVVHRAAEEVIHSLRIFSSPLEKERMLRELSAMLSRYLLGPPLDGDSRSTASSGP